jgi:hypothetical protein
LAPVHSLAHRYQRSGVGANVFYAWSYFGAPSSNGAQNFKDQDGYAIEFDANIGLTNWWQEDQYYRRRAPTWNFNETATWIRGKHTVSFGGSMMTVRSDREDKVVVPGINLGFNNNSDLARTLFTLANFPGASTAQLTDARELYGLVTAADRRHRPGRARSQDQQVHGVRHSRNVDQDGRLRRVLAGFLEGRAHPDAHRRHPLGRPGPRPIAER